MVPFHRRGEERRDESSFQDDDRAAGRYRAEWRAAERLTLYLSQNKHHRGVSDHVEIVRRARSLGVAGATVLQGVEGFGVSGTVHRRHTVPVAEDVPVVLIVVDTAERIDAFLTEIADLTAGAMVVRCRVQILLQRGERST